MLTNFSHEKIEVKKGSILGVAEETHAELVACLNETNIPNSKKYNEATDALVHPLFQAYLNEKLAHLTAKCGARSNRM
jgi:hypothetical protein